MNDDNQDNDGHVTDEDVQAFIRARAQARRWFDVEAAVIVNNMDAPTPNPATWTVYGRPLTDIQRAIVLTSIDDDLTPGEQFDAIVARGNALVDDLIFADIARNYDGEGPGGGVQP